MGNRTQKVPSDLRLDLQFRKRAVIPSHPDDTLSVYNSAVYSQLVSQANITLALTLT